MHRLGRWRELAAGLGGGAAFLIFHHALGATPVAILAGAGAAAATWAGLRLIIPPAAADGPGGPSPAILRARAQLGRLATLLPTLDEPVAGPLAGLIDCGVAVVERADRGGSLSAADRTLVASYLETALRIVEHHTALRRLGGPDHGDRVATLMAELERWARSRAGQGAGVALEAELALLDRMLSEGRP